MAGALLIGELFLPGLFFALSFAAGALCAAVGSAAYMSFTGQLTLCFVVAVVTFMFLRILARRQVRHIHYQSNYEALIGKQACVLACGNDLQGSVKVSGEVWAAIFEEQCEPGDVVRIVKIKGNRVFIQRKE
jgi:membrane protein implicated in regulation of membrane protease activity